MKQIGHGETRFGLGVCSCTVFVAGRRICAMSGFRCGSSGRWARQRSLSACGTGAQTMTVSWTCVQHVYSSYGSRAARRIAHNAERLRRYATRP